MSCNSCFGGWELDKGTADSSVVFTKSPCYCFSRALDLISSIRTCFLTGWIRCLFSLSLDVQRPSPLMRRLSGEVKGVLTAATTARAGVMIDDLPAVCLTCPVALLINVPTRRTFLLSGFVAPFDPLERCYHMTLLVVCPDKS